VQTKLIDFFAAHRDVTEVTFVGCDLGASGASMLANGLRSFSWTSLTVRDDCIEAGMSEFCEALASNETLKSLMLAGGPNRPEEACLHADSAKLLANVLRKNRTLVSLALVWTAFLLGGQYLPLSSHGMRLATKARFLLLRRSHATRRCKNSTSSLTASTKRELAPSWRAWPPMVGSTH